MIHATYDLPLTWREVGVCKDLQQKGFGPTELVFLFGVGIRCIFCLCLYIFYECSSFVLAIALYTVKNLDQHNHFFALLTKTLTVSKMYFLDYNSKQNIVVFSFVIDKLGWSSHTRIHMHTEANCINRSLFCVRQVLIGSV